MAGNIVVIGGGAAGFFGAITCAETNPEKQVFLIEKTSKLLAKVRVSGGGRCNATHHCFSPAKLIQHYPRGGKQLKNPFTQFGPAETIKWFESRGVKLKTEADGRMFPVTDSSETIIVCLMQQARNSGVKIITSTSVEKISPKQTETERWELALSDGKLLQAESVLICTGGSPKAENYRWLAALNHTIVPPVPSLFTFNVPDSPLQELMGISVPNAKVKIAGQKLEQEGPLLITHWGFSGPAVLKTSARGARI